MKFGCKACLQGFFLHRAGSMVGGGGGRRGGGGALPFRTLSTAKLPPPFFRALRPGVFFHPSLFLSCRPPPSKIILFQCTKVIPTLSNSISCNEYNIFKIK